eukprot:487850-Pelagomonas_calceolata.AAC.7
MLLVLPGVWKAVQLFRDAGPDIHARTEVLGAQLLCPWGGALGTASAALRVCCAVDIARGLESCTPSAKCSLSKKTEMPHQLITSFVWTRKVTKQLPSLLATSKLDYMDPLKLQMAAGLHAFACTHAHTHTHTHTHVHPGLSSPMSPLDYTSLTSFPGFANNLSGLSTAAFPSNMGHLSSDMQWGAGASQVCLTCGVADVQWVTCMRSRGKPGVCVTCSMGGMQWEQGQAKWVL